MAGQSVIMQIFSEFSSSPLLMGEEVDGVCGPQSVFGCLLRWPTVQEVTLADLWLSRLKGCWRT